MKDLTLKQHDIAETLINNFDCILKIDAIKFIKKIFGSTFNLKDTVIAYNSIEKFKN